MGVSIGTVSHKILSWDTYPGGAMLVDSHNSVNKLSHL